MKKSKKKEVSEDLLKDIAILVLIVITVSLSLICLGTIKLSHINKESIKEYEKNHNYFDVVKEIDNYLEVDASKFGNLINLDVTEESTRLYDTCHESCNLKINYGGIDYYYFINKKYDTGYYFLTIVKDNKAIIYNKELGNSIVNLQVISYLGYITIYNTIMIEDLPYDYDYAIMVDSNLNKDEFSSLFAREMSFTDQGIVYYYDLCEKDTSYKIKAIRKPFNDKAKILDKTEENFSWCNSVK